MGNWLCTALLPGEFVLGGGGFLKLVLHISLPRVVEGVFVTQLYFWFIIICKTLSSSPQFDQNTSFLHTLWRSWAEMVWWGCIWFIIVKLWNSEKREVFVRHFKHSVPQGNYHNRIIWSWSQTALEGKVHILICNKASSLGIDSTLKCPQNRSIFPYLLYKPNIG